MKAKAVLVFTVVALLSMPTTVVEAADACSGAIPDDSPQACGSMIMQGDRTGLFRFYLPQDATFRYAPSDSPEGGDFTITAADDRFAGFVLQLEKPDPLAAYYAMAWQFPADLGGSDPGRSKYETEALNLPGDGDVLPSGWYRLYLLTEPGVDAEVALHLGGLSGTRQIRPQHEPTFKLSRPTVTGVPTPDGAMLYSASDTGQIAKGDYPERGGGILIN